MELQLLRDQPLNTLLIVEGGPLYSIESRGFLSSKTEIRRARKDVAIEDTKPVAIIEWGGVFSKTMVQVGGQTRAWDEILCPTGKWFSDSRTFTSPTGKTYKWKPSGGHLSLIDSSSSIIGDYSRSGRGSSGPGRSRKALMNLSEQCLPMLDLVIVTWIIMEQNRRKRERRKRAAVGAAVS